MVLGSILTKLNFQTFSFFATELFCGRYDSTNFDRERYLSKSWPYQPLPWIATKLANSKAFRKYKLWNEYGKAILSNPPFLYGAACLAHKKKSRDPRVKVPA